MMLIESAGLTDVGRKRKSNEDSFLVDDRLKLYIVADGMGGHQAGEVASRVVVETIRQYMAGLENGLPGADELSDSDATLSKKANRLLSGVHLANRSVNELARRKESYHGMGSTVSAVYFDNGFLVAVNVGDSPIYLVHNGRIELLSVPHTVMAQQKALGVDWPENLLRRFSHVLTRAMGVEETVEADVSEIQCFDGDVLVIGSDGLSDKVSPEEILGIVTCEPPGKACRSLVDLANQRGGDDNITAIVIKVNAAEYRKDGIGTGLSRWLRRLLGWSRKEKLKHRENLPCRL